MKSLLVRSIAISSFLLSINNANAVADVKAPKKHVDHFEAMQVCEMAAKSKMALPDTVDFSYFNASATDFDNGRTMVLAPFSAKNVFGVEMNYRIRCLFGDNALLEFNILK